MNHPISHPVSTYPVSNCHVLSALVLLLFAPMAMSEVSFSDKPWPVHQDLLVEHIDPNGLEKTLEDDMRLDEIAVTSTAEKAVSTDTQDTISKPTDDVEGSAEPTIEDPWEGVNRRVFGFNNKADQYVLRPVAVAYDTVTPKSVQRGVSNFFVNLKAPATLINELLQGRALDSVQTLGRFAINTTVGLVGVFDPASAIGWERRNEDFGQTLAVWGWDNPNYLVLPLLGPLTTRDLVGFIGDTPTNPMNYVDGGAMVGLQSLEITDMRTQMLAWDELRAGAIDEYAMVRDAWSQGRKQEIKEGTLPQVKATEQEQAGGSLLQRLFQ